jgi:hypothetical protein
LLQEKPKRLLKKHRRLFTVSAYNYALGNSSNLVDPTGRFPCGGICTALAIGAGGGALVGGGVEAGLQLWNNGEITDWGAVGTATLKGATTGATGVAFGPGGAALGAFGSEITEGAIKQEGTAKTLQDATLAGVSALVGGTTARGFRSASLSAKKFKTLVTSNLPKKEIKKIVSEIAKGTSVDKILSIPGDASGRAVALALYGALSEGNIELEGSLVERLGLTDPASAYQKP